jgi:hypothetical protein
VFLKVFLSRFKAERIRMIKIIANQHKKVKKILNFDFKTKNRRDECRG